MKKLMLISVVLLAGSAFAQVNVDGVLSAGEWTGHMYTDATGTYGDEGLTSASLSEAGSPADLYTWGAKIENGIFYGMFQLNPLALRTISEYDLATEPISGKQTKIYLGYCVDVDPGAGTGHAHNDFAAEGARWDAMLEVGVDYGTLMDLNPGHSINLWNSNGTDFDNDVNISTGSDAYVVYNGYVLEFSVAVNDILSSFVPTDGAVAGDTWVMAGRVAANLRFGASDYKADTGSVETVNVPEPATIALLCMGGLLLKRYRAKGN